MNETELNAVIGLGGIILTIGLIAVLTQGFDLHKYPKTWSDELRDRYIPELIRKKEPMPDASEEKGPSEAEDDEEEGVMTDAVE